VAVRNYKFDARECGQFAERLPGSQGTVYYFELRTKPVSTVTCVRFAGLMSGMVRHHGKGVNMGGSYHGTLSSHIPIFVCVNGKFSHKS
jgi:hypothetical protein